MCLLLVVKKTRLKKPFEAKIKERLPNVYWHFDFLLQRRPSPSIIYGYLEGELSSVRETVSNEKSKFFNFPIYSVSYEHPRNMLRLTNYRRITTTGLKLRTYILKSEYLPLKATLKMIQILDDICGFVSEMLQINTKHLVS